MWNESTKYYAEQMITYHDYLSIWGSNLFMLIEWAPADG